MCRVQDSCLVLPDFKASEVTAFHRALFSRDPVLLADLGPVCRVGQLFGLQHYCNSGAGRRRDCQLDYQEIFRQQATEYLGRVQGGHKELAEEILRFGQIVYWKLTGWCVG